MTTKSKIIAGFGVLVLLLVAMGVIGLNGIRNAVTNFSGSNRLAQLNVTLSDANTFLAAGSMSVHRFLLFVDDNDIQSGLEYVDISIAEMEDALAFITFPERIEQTKSIIADLRLFREAFIKVTDLHKQVHALYNDGFYPAALNLEERLTTINQNAINANNTAALTQLNRIWQASARAREEVATYINGMNPAVAERAGATFDSLDRMLADFRQVMTSDLARRDYAAVAEVVTTAHNAYNELYAFSQEALKEVALLYEVELRVSNGIDDLNAGVDEQDRQFSQTADSDNRAAQTAMMTTLAVGIVVAILMASLIVFGIIRVLGRMAAFATSIAEGRFDFDPQIREKGEIGNMLQALEAIPAILRDVVFRSNRLAGNIASGKFRTRLHEENFAGDFKELALAVNAVCTSYTAAFDNLPLSIITADNDRNLQFLNTQAQAIAGGNAEGDFCGDKLQAEVCQDPKTCHGCLSMETIGQSSGEVAIYPDGNRMDLSLSTTPLHDLDGNVAGFMEIISDISTIKAQEITMRRVANDASEISDRVAAAEELAAQVEQVSRGAENQREQMQTTASAMSEMNATVLEVAHNASQASEQSELTRTNAVSGAELVDSVVQAIREVHEVAMKLQANMEDLGHQAESIGGVMNVISDIADQTNLLALNAAIEAARAGDAGRGFAVVADSVRNLAEKTMSATQEVGSSITAIQNSTRLNIADMEAAVTSVTQATELANSSGQALEQIVHLAGATSGVVASIATAAEEQSATSEEITLSIEQVNTIVGETSEGMVQSSSAVQDLSRQAQELRRVLDELR